ncbi:hypothetical protein [Nakamurella leprariae]|uniref:Uncharacterized protein n=1 Tax=Nakamurella leprariae TaxID=2803911 RepID=A0A938YBP9_9ACTN|nr:hypothetical protein [Nakamurella leprariae]MBM9466656.1 hypothetical protein [Nakamurella leprariae]
MSAPRTWCHLPLYGRVLRGVVTVGGLTGALLESATPESAGDAPPSLLLVRWSVREIKRGRRFALETTAASATAEQRMMIDRDALEWQHRTGADWATIHRFPSGTAVRILAGWSGPALRSHLAPATPPPLPGHRGRHRPLRAARR